MTTEPENVLNLNDMNRQPGFNDAVMKAISATVRQREEAFQKAWANVAAAINVQADARIALDVARASSANVMPAAQAFRKAEADTLEAVGAVVDLAVKLRLEPPKIEVEGFGIIEAGTTPS